MTPREFQKRRDYLMGEERARKVLAWFWLSFADDEGFNGASLIKAWGPITAHFATKLAAPDLHGEVQIVEMPDWYTHEEQINAWLRFRPSIMRTKEECDAFERNFEKHLKSLGFEIEEPN